MLSNELYVAGAKQDIFCFYFFFVCFSDVIKGVTERHRKKQDGGTLFILLGYFRPGW